MISSCTHCDAKYQLPDKMLGKQARCKACKRSFVIMPSEDEVELPDPGIGTQAPVQQQAPNPELDGLDALADAASHAHDHPAPHHRSAPRHSEADDEPRGQRRMAKGATAAMVMGIASCVFVAAAVTLMIIAMINGENQDLLVILGIITLGLLSITAITAMLAIANGTSASKKIRRARHPLDGRREASTGSLTGVIALGIVFACAITIGIYLARTGGIKFQKEVLQSSQITAAPPVA